jgi:DNA replication protein DnaC
MRIAKSDYPSKDIEKRLREAGIPELYRDVTLDSLDATRAPEAFTICRQFAEMPDDIRRCLLLLGGSGVGKTCLAVAILHQIIRNSFKSGRFWNAPEGFAAIRASFGNGDTESSMIKVLGNSLIVIDDLGKQRLTEWSREQLFVLIDGIYSRERLCIITSNLHEEEFVATFDDAVTSRIIGMSRIITVSGDDWRLESAA